MIASRITATAQLYRHQAGAKDAAGDVTSSFADPEPIKVELQQIPGELGAQEKRDGQLVATSRWIALLRPSDTITHLDELEVAGDRYTVDGEPWLVRNPRTGRNSHWQVKLRKVK